MRKALVVIVFALLVSPAGAQTAKKCDKGSSIQKQACWLKEVAGLRKAIDTKVAEACRKSAIAGGPPPKTEEILACRGARLAKIAEGI